MERPSRLNLDALTLDAIGAGVLAGRNVSVLGFARSGIALARFFADAGARVTIYDGRPAGELTASIAALEGRQARLRLGPRQDLEVAWADADLVATSPSINPDYPTTEPLLREALRALVGRAAAGDPSAPPVVSEADLVLRLCPAPTVGITGTKGKTTTSALTAALLGAVSPRRHPVALGGNIGDPLVDRLFELTPRHRVVIELSELQLPTLSRGTTVAAYTNVTSDHLDRHGSLAAYRAAKRRLAELVDPAGALILNADDPVVAAFEGPRGVQTLFYRADRPVPGGVGLRDGWIVSAGVERLGIAGGGPAPTLTRGRVLPIDELAIPGRHNVHNALAAVAVALLFGVAPRGIRAAARAFTGVEHRLEPAGEIDGVRFVNDSQGTQPDAVIAALRAFEAPIVLIAGGRDKDIDLGPLAPVVAERAIAAVLIGESGPTLERLFRDAGLARTERATTLEEAVDAADAIAREARSTGGTSTVLLSPAAASFDMFVDYADRGRAFKRAVADLAARRAAEREEAR